MAAGATLKGMSMPDGEDPFHWPDGGYGRFAHQWWAKTPGGHIANLAGHDVTQHDDTTITVSPSILVSERRAGEHHELWHGYLEHGVWRQV